MFQVKSAQAAPGALQFRTCVVPANRLQMPVPYRSLPSPSRSPYLSSVTLLAYPSCGPSSVKPWDADAASRHRNGCPAPILACILGVTDKLSTSPITRPTRNRAISGSRMPFRLHLLSSCCLPRGTGPAQLHTTPHTMSLPSPGQRRRTTTLTHRSTSACCHCSRALHDQAPSQVSASRL